MRIITFVVGMGFDRFVRSVDIGGRNLRRKETREPPASLLMLFLVFWTPVKL